MYAKFSKRGHFNLARDIRAIEEHGVFHRGDLVVPRTSVVVEVSQIGFKKYRVLSEAEFEEHMLCLPDCSILFWTDLGGGLPEEGVEYIVAWYERVDDKGMPGPTTTVVAMDACLFLMGNTGQTIDRLCCEAE